MADSENTPVDYKINRNNWLFEHPVWLEIESFNFKNSNQQRVSMTVYLDLCEAKDWWSMKVHGCSQLQLVYLSGKSQRKAPVEYILPLPADTELSQERLQEFLHHIPANVDHSHSNDQKSVTLAISDSDSSTVYYKVTNGIALPDDVIDTVANIPIPTEVDIFSEKEL
ncbi:tRNA-splicing endonuclease subunit Sen15-like [Anneissia japonica]|uniref:tRNA-splicing endonuclease subunit Sen15-like n=1 Tax=Anneissia japonica TaxID=1529436 RepID=UPI001425992D|nr:tRNA-splicing endonuclease subunit Sen15-like [Anneissia japonica]